MRKSRFSEEQIIAILKAEAEEETAWEAVSRRRQASAQRSYAGSTGSAMRRSTNGVRSMAV